MTVAESDADPAWAYADYVRDIWVSPDGSGRIAEQFQPFVYPNDEEQGEAARWSAPPQASGINQTFQPNELSYFSIADLDNKLKQNSAPTEDGEGVLQFYASYLFEAVPDGSIVKQAVSLARSKPDIASTENGYLLTFTATDANQDGTVLRLTFDTSRDVLTREERIAAGPLDGLSLAPPVEVLDRQLMQSEDLGDWSPPSPTDAGLLEDLSGRRTLRRDR